MKAIVNLLFILWACGACTTSPDRAYVNHRANVSLSADQLDLQSAVLLNFIVDQKAGQGTLIYGTPDFMAGMDSGRPLEGKVVLIHWAQAEDEVWMGARIPGQFLYADWVSYAIGSEQVGRIFPDGSAGSLTEADQARILQLAQLAQSPLFP